MDFVDNVQLWTAVHAAKRVKLNPEVRLADGFVPVTSGLFGFVQRMSLKGARSSQDTPKSSSPLHRPNTKAEDSTSGPYSLKIKDSTGDIEKSFLTRNKSLSRLLMQAEGTSCQLETQRMFKSSSEMLTEQATADDPLSIIHSTKSKHFDRERSPVILNVQPIRVSTLGNTPVTIVGYNLGKDPDDVAHLFICGQDCVEGIEYVSSTKLKCRVKRWVPCRGVVTLYTKSGGKGVACQLLEVFDSLYGDAEEKPDDETSHLAALQQLKANKAALTMENTKCIVRINGLEEQNREAKAYVRRLQSLPPAEKFPSQRRSSFYSGH